MMQLTWLGKILPVAGLLLIAAVMAACGGGGSTSDKGVAKTTISGSVTFPALGSIVAKQIGAEKVVAAETDSVSLEIRDLGGNLVKTVPLTLQGGAYAYSVTDLPIDKDYVLKAVKGLMVLRALVDKAALSGSTTTKNVNNISTTALIVVEKALSLTAGTLGQTASTVQAQAASQSLALMSTPANIESNITEAIAACTTSGTATASQAQLASLANIVTAAVGSNVDASTFLAGAATVATVNATTYTVTGTTPTGSTAAVNTGTAGGYATDFVATLPKISSAGSTTFTVGTDGTFTITGTGTLSTSGTLPSGVAFYPGTGALSGTGVLSGTPATGSNGAYTIIVTATGSNGLTATQAFTLTVNPAVVVTPPVGFTTEMISGKTFATGSIRIKFFTDKTLTVNDTQDALTWTINSLGKVVVNNATNSSTTTMTLVSGNLASGLQVSMVHTDDNTTETATLTVATSGPQSLVGSWYVPYNSAGQAKGPIVFTFLDDTHFIMAHDGDIVADPSGQPGIERGTYTWNPATGALIAQAVTDSNGEWGLSNPGVGESINLKVSLDGNSLLFNGFAFATKVKESSSSPIIGSWYAPDSDGGIAITFLDGTNYMMAHDGVNDPYGQRGIERGTYTWNPATGAITVVATVDTNGEWGFSNASEKFTVSSDGKSLFMDGAAFGLNVNTNQQLISSSFTPGSVTAHW